MTNKNYAAKKYRSETAMLTQKHTFRKSLRKNSKSERFSKKQNMNF